MHPEDLRGAASLAELLTSLRRRRPPTEPLLRRKFDALSRSAVDALPFLVERTVVARHGRLSPHERDAGRASPPHADHHPRVRRRAAATSRVRGRNGNH